MNYSLRLRSGILKILKSKVFLSIYTGLILLICAFSLGSKGDLINADTLTSLSFASDVIHSASIKNWQLAPAPAILSEVLPAIIAQLLTNSPFVQLALIQLFQILILFICLKKIGQLFNFSNPALAALGTVTLLSFGVAFEHFWLFHIVNNMHMGALFLGMLSLISLIKLIKSSRPFVACIQLFVLFLLGLLAIIESKLYYVHFTIPAILFLFFFYSQNRLVFSFKKTALYSSIILLPLILGQIISRVFPALDATQTYPMSGLESIQISLSILGETVQYFVFHYSDPMIRIVFLFAVLISVQFFIKRKFMNFHNFFIVKSTQALVAWIAISSFSVLVVFLISGRFRMPIYDLRYFTFPLILLAYLLVDIATKYFSQNKALLFITLIFVFPAAGSIRGFKVNEAYDPLISCMKKISSPIPLTDGISGYWLAKPIEYYSDYKFHMVQLTPSFEFFSWMNRTDLMTTRRDGKVPHFNFVVEDWWLTNEKIIKFFGPPSYTVECRAGPFNNGYETFKDTIVKIHIFDGSTLDGHIKSLLDRDSAR